MTSSRFYQFAAYVSFAFASMSTGFSQWDYTINDALNGVMYATDENPNPCCFNSGYIFQNLNQEQLDDADNEYTLFVPTQAAVEEIMGLMNLNQWDLVGFSDLPTALDYHIVPGTFLAEDLTDGMSLLTLQGQSLSVSVNGDVMINDAMVTQTNITADNGVIHVIDKTLAPEGYPEATVVEAVKQSENHTSFEQGISNAFMEDFLRAQALEADDDNNGDPLPGPFTLFAPNDDAVSAFALANGYENSEDFLNSQNVDEFIRRHVVIGSFSSVDLVSGQILQSLSGEPIEIELTSNGLLASGASIETADIAAYNGVVHSIADVLPLDILPIEGTCGTWSVNLFNASDSQDWGESSVDIYIDGNLFASETNNELAVDEDFDGWIEEMGISTFSFAADEGTTIDIIFSASSGSSSASYEVVDENGNVIFESEGDTQYPPASIFGLRPCGGDVSCGLLELTLVDQSQEGWFGGALEVFSYEYGSYATIDFGNYFQSLYPFWQIKAFVPVNAGEFGIAVSEPLVNADACGYLVQAPGGELLVDQTSTLLPPEGVEGLIACAEGDDAVCNASFDVSQGTLPGGQPIPGAVDIIIYDYNNNATYSWDFGDEGTSDDPFASWQYATDGPYNLCLTVTDEAAGCSDTFCESISVDSLGNLNGIMAGFVINVIDGGLSGSANSILEESVFSAVSIYPNPANDFIMIAGIESNTSWNGRLIDITGAVIRDFNETGASRQSLSGIPTGLYFLQLTSDTFMNKVLRVVIE